MSKLDFFFLLLLRLFLVVGRQWIYQQKEEEENEISYTAQTNTLMRTHDQNKSNVDDGDGDGDDEHWKRRRRDGTNATHLKQSNYLLSTHCSDSTNANRFLLSFVPLLTWSMKWMAMCESYFWQTIKRREKNIQQN